jgi:hypothetical protein
MRIKQLGAASIDLIPTRGFRGDRPCLSHPGTSTFSQLHVAFPFTYGKIASMQRSCKQVAEYARLVAGQGRTVMSLPANSPDSTHGSISLFEQIAYLPLLFPQSIPPITAQFRLIPPNTAFKK